MAKNKGFLHCYRQYQNKIFTYFWYRVNFNRPLAEDLTSEVFLKAFCHFDSFDINSSFQAWIFTIDRNHLQNFYRTANREVSLKDAEKISHDCHRQVELSLELEKIINIIHTLEEYYREVLLLRFVDGLNNQEIALVLDKDEGAVRTQICRALEILREKLK